MRGRGAAAALIAGLLLAPGPAAGQAANARSAIVVLPFDNPGQDLRIAWLREGAALLVSNMLDAERRTVVTRDERLRAFERLQLPAGAFLSRASSIKVGQALGATAVVVGALDVASGMLTARARMVRLDTGRLMPEVHADGPLADLYGVFGRLTAQLDGAASPDMMGRLPLPPPVFELFVKGLVAEAPPASLSYFEQVLRAVPSYDEARLALWQVHTDGGDHTRALAAVSRVKADSRVAGEGRFLEGLSLISLKRYLEAVAVLRALEVDRPSAAVANAIGVAELRRAPAPGRATYYFSQASQLDPADGDLCFNLGYAYWLEHDAKAAIYWLREAVRRNPADGDAHFVMAESLRQAGAVTEAARERELAHHLSSKYASWESRAGEPVPRGLERIDDSMTPARTTVETLAAAAGQRDQASQAQFHLDAGRRAFEREADREAIDELRRALFLSPYLAEAHLLLGRLYLRASLVSEAIDTLKIALWSEESVPAHLALAEAYLAGADGDGARAEVERALALDPTSVEARQLRARLGGPPW